MSDTLVYENGNKSLAPESPFRALQYRSLMDGTEEVLPLEAALAPAEEEHPFVVGLLQEQISKLQEELSRLSQDQRLRLEEAEALGRSKAMAEVSRLRDQEKHSFGERASLVLDRLERESLEYLARLEQEVIRLTLAIATKVIGHEAQIDRLFLAGAVRLALADLGKAGRIVLKVPAADREGWTEMVDTLSFAGREIAVEGADRMQLGECILMTTFGEIDLGGNSQLGEIKKAFDQGCVGASLGRGSSHA